MQYTSQQYAQVLHELIDGVDQKQALTMCEQFVGHLKKEGREHLLSSIVAAYRTILTKHNELPEVTVRTAHDVDDKEIAKVLASLEIDKERPVKKMVDQEMIGGVVVKDNNRVYDLSLQRRLARLSQKLHS